jgi:hypothetical protein
MVMSERVWPQCKGAFDGDSGVLSEIDHALALIGAAHWTEPFRMGFEAKLRSAAYDREAARVLVDRGMR